MQKKSKKKTYELLTLISSLVYINESSIFGVFRCISNLSYFCEYESYFTYFSNVWLNGNFPTGIWSVASKRDIDQRFYEWLKHSNNMIESFHGVLNYTLKKSEKPTMLEFVFALKFVEANAINTLNTYDDKYVYDVMLFYYFSLFLGNQVYSNLCF